MICCYEMRKGRGSCVEPSSLKNFGSMFDAEAIHAQIPSNIEPNYQRTWCNGHTTGHASFLSSYIAILPLVSSVYVLGQPGMRSNREETCHLLAADFPPHSRYTERCWTQSGGLCGARGGDPPFWGAGGMVGSSGLFESEF